jgi:TetR/AcrR family transcriptional regulator, fatty acid metabolism regulator protein
MQDRYDSILEAAKQVFAAKGFEAASIAEIARTAGVSDGLVYRYFQNKRDLLFHVMRVFYERILVDLEDQVARGMRFQERLHRLVARHLEVFVADTDLCRLFISEVRVASDYQGSPIQSLNRRYTSVLLQLVEEGVAAGEVRPEINPRLVRDVIFGAIEHVAWRHVNGRSRLDIPSVARDLTDLIACGIRTTGGERR